MPKNIQRLALAVALMTGGLLMLSAPANAATNQHDFIVALEHSLKREAAGITRGDELPQSAPSEEPQEPRMPSLRIAPAD